MKITKEHYAELKDSIEQVIKINKFDYKEFKQALDYYPKVKDSEMRLRWGLYWGIPTEQRKPLTDELYKYCSDSHIDTALKQIVKELNPLT
jgi:hypothetical protein